MKLVFNHSHRVKPIGRVISSKRVNDELIIIVRSRKGVKNMIVDFLKALFWLIVAYLILAVLFNWWPINTLNWPM